MHPRPFLCLPCNDVRYLGHLDDTCPTCGSDELELQADIAPYRHTDATDAEADLRLHGAVLGAEVTLPANYAADGWLRRKQA